jgi:DNA helicase IV
MDAETVKLLFTALGAGSGGAALLALINGLFKWLSGAARREQIRNTTLSQQRAAAIKEKDEAEAETENEIRKRREAEEHVAKLQRQIILLGAEPVKHGTVRNEE